MREALLSWLQAPLHGKLYYSQVMGAFDYLMQACLLVGILPAVPVLIYNLVSFVRPALPGTLSRGQIMRIVASSTILTIGGVLFAYYVSLPLVLRFLSSIDVAHLHPLIAANSYLTFVINYLTVFAIIFQLPLVVLFIDRITPIPPARMQRWRKWVILGAFSAAFILPIAPDPVSQIMLAVPIVILYEASLWLLLFRHRPRRMAAPIIVEPAVAAMDEAQPRSVVHANSRPQGARRVRQDPLLARRSGVIDLSNHVIDLRQSHG
jgi:sec-independent protein translocase protein TatC